MNLTEWNARLHGLVIFRALLDDDVIAKFVDLTDRMAAALLASCNKETEMMNPAPEVRPDGASVTITLSSGDDVQTRTFFDATATAEAWEKSLVRSKIGEQILVSFSATA